MEGIQKFKSYFTQRNNSLKDLAILTLSDNSNLTAKQIYYTIKNKSNINFSYQALHKTLNNLINLGVLKKENKYYSVDENWINFLEEFIEKVKDLNKKKIDIGTRVQLPRSKKRIKAISFDLVGCLSDNSFDDIFWNRKIPSLVAKQKNISFEDAYKLVVEEYKRLWGKVDEWRNPDFWLRHFNIKEPWEEIIADIKHEIKHYGDSVPVVNKLRKNYTIIIISHADRRFLNLKLQTEKLGKLFHYTFSTPDDFGSMKKDANVYKKICKILGVKATEMIHIGDNYEFDYVIPTSVGIKSFLIDRSGKLKEEYVVRSLYDFENKIKDLNNF